jgi:hypothetical protein
MAEDAAEPGSRKDPQKDQKAGRHKAMPAGFFHPAFFMWMNLDALGREALNALNSRR